MLLAVPKQKPASTNGSKADGVVHLGSRVVGCRLADVPLPPHTDVSSARTRRRGSRGMSSVWTSLWLPLPVSPARARRSGPPAMTSKNSTVLHESKTKTYGVVHLAKRPSSSRYVAPTSTNDVNMATAAKTNARNRSGSHSRRLTACSLVLVPRSNAVPACHIVL